MSDIILYNNKNAVKNAIKNNEVITVLKKDKDNIDSYNYKIDNTELGKVLSVTKEFAQTLINKRLELKLTRKELAKKLNMQE